MNAIAIPQREILIPRFEFPRFLRNLKDEAVDKMLAPLGGVLSPLAVSTLFTPTNIAGLRTWLKADATNNTLSTTGYAGTGAVSQSGTAITGVGTSFVGEVKVGDTLTGTNISGTVTAIADATHLTVNASNTGSGASYTINPTAGVSDRATTLADQTANGANATQSTAKNKPAKFPNRQNGLPLIASDGVNDAISFSANIPTAVAVYSLFLAFRRDVNLQGILMSGNGGNGYENLSYSQFSGNFTTYDGDTTARFNNNVSQFILLEIVKSATNNVNGWRNGVSVFSAKSQGTGGPTGWRGLFFRFDSTNSWAAHSIGELLIYDSALSTADRQSVEAYLNARWAIF